MKVSVMKISVFFLVFRAGGRRNKNEDERDEKLVFFFVFRVGGNEEIRIKVSENQCFFLFLERMGQRNKDEGLMKIRGLLCL